MEGRWASVWVWCMAVLALAAMVALVFYRRDVHALEAQRQEAIRQDMEGRRAHASLKQLQAQVPTAERARDRAQAFLRQDLLIPRAILAIQSTVPPGIGIESVAWDIDYLVEGPCLVLDVSGWAATPVEKQAQDAWGAWMKRLGGWEVSLKPLSVPVWSRRRTGQEPSLAFRATFRTPPTPIPPK